MNLDNLTVEIRPRTLFEGIDLGFVLARKYFLTLWLIYLITAFPVFFILNLFFWDDILWFAVLMIWLKPLFETPLLHWLSQAIFNEKIALPGLIKALPNILKTSVFKRLTYGRFSPSRSFYLPVVLLEKLKAKAYRERVRILGYNQSAGIGLTLICFVFELILFGSVISLLFIIIPEDLRWFDFEGLFSSDEVYTGLIVNTVVFFCISIIAPFYVAGGFALYLTRRTEFEAWDIELKLRGLLKRNEKAGETKGLKTAAVLLFIALSLLCTSGDLTAEPINKPQAAQEIKKILSHEDFGIEKKQTVWKLKDIWEKKDKEYKEPAWIEFFLMLSKIAGVAGEIILWVVGSLVVIFIIYQLARHQEWFQGASGSLPSRNNIPDELFGLKLSKEALPDDLEKELAGLLEKAEYRKFLSLMYRSLLIRFIHDFHIDIPDSATEGECVRIVGVQRSRQEKEFFTALTHIWLKMAYGHIPPVKAEIENLFESWNQTFNKTQTAELTK